MTREIQNDPCTNYYITFENYDLQNFSNFFLRAFRIRTNTFRIRRCKTVVYFNNFFFLRGNSSWEKLRINYFNEIKPLIFFLRVDTIFPI